MYDLVCKLMSVLDFLLTKIKMYCIPLIRSAGDVTFFGLHSSNAGIIVRKSIKLMHEIITIIHSKPGFISCSAH